MGEEHDIIAGFSGGAANSVGALAVYLQGSCGHAVLDERVIAQGFRFYPWMSDDIPHFFNKRFTSGHLNLAVTLQGGMDVEGGDDPFDGCDSHGEAKRIIVADSYVSSLWTARVTVDIDFLRVAKIADPLFIAKHPTEFRMIADELVALGVVQSRSCPLCSDTES